MNKNIIFSWTQPNLTHYKMKNSDPNPTQPNPIQPNPWVNPTHVHLWSVRQHTHRDSSGGGVCDAASVHFVPTARRTKILVLIHECSLLDVSSRSMFKRLNEPFATRLGNAAEIALLGQIAAADSFTEPRFRRVQPRSDWLTGSLQCA